MEVRLGHGAGVLRGGHGDGLAEERADDAAGLTDLDAVLGPRRALLHGIALGPHGEAGTGEEGDRADLDVVDRQLRHRRQTLGAVTLARVASLCTLGVRDRSTGADVLVRPT